MNERLALLGLWSVCGFGATRLKALQTVFQLGDIAGLPCKTWLKEVELPPHVAAAFPADATLQRMGEQVLQKAQNAHMQLVFRGQPEFPPGLEVLKDAPPLLFAWGEVVPVEVPKVAMVGPRQVEPFFVPEAKHFASRMAQAGMLVVSGAAEGVDQACLQAAMEISGKAWAFVGCGLDCLALAQRTFWQKCMSRGGTYFSEYPPGTQANKFTYPHRNRLISAAADAVLVLRAPQKSGSLHTACAALKQRRPLWVVPGKPHNDMAQGCLQLLRRKEARLATTPEEVMLSLGREVELPEVEAELPEAAVEQRSFFSLRGGEEEEVEVEVEVEVEAGEEAPPAAEPPTDEPLSPEALHVYAQLKGVMLFEELLAATRIDSATLSGLLCELELSGKVEQKPGKRYETVSKLK